MTDALDARDGIIADIANEIGVRVVRRENNDIALYTDSGVTLFETKARNVTFDPTGNLGPGTSGRSVYVDGVPVTGNGVAMGICSGGLAGLSEMRDEVLARIGDVVAAARGSATMVRRTVEPVESSLVGHHGSLTSAEQHIPLLLGYG